MADIKQYTNFSAVAAELNALHARVGALESEVKLDEEKQTALGEHLAAVHQSFKPPYTLVGAQPITVKPEPTDEQLSAVDPGHPAEFTTPVTIKVPSLVPPQAPDQPVAAAPGSGTGRYGGHDNWTFGSDGKDYPGSYGVGPAPFVPFTEEPAVIPAPTDTPDTPVAAKQEA